MTALYHLAATLSPLESAVDILVLYTHAPIDPDKRAFKTPLRRSVDALNLQPAVITQDQLGNRMVERPDIGNCFLTPVPLNPARDPAFDKVAGAFGGVFADPQQAAAFLRPQLEALIGPRLRGVAPGQTSEPTAPLTLALDIKSGPARRPGGHASTAVWI